MSNTYITLPVPLTDGAGAAQDTSALGAVKTITVTGDFSGVLQVEVSNDGGTSFFPITSLDLVNRKVILTFVGEFMRVRRQNTDGFVGGAAEVKVAAETVSDGKFAALDVPTSIGPGATTDITLFGTINTVIGTGGIRNVFGVEVSEDGSEWLECLTFNGPDIVTKLFTGRYIRLNLKASVNPGGPTGPITFSIGSLPEDATAFGQDELVKISVGDTTSDYLENKITAGMGVTLTKLNVGGDEEIEISAPGAASDELVKVTSNDTTPDYLLPKLVAGTDITITEQNDGGNETVEIASTAADELVKVTSNDTTPDYLLPKLQAGANITLNELNDGGNEKVEIVATDTNDDEKVKISANDTTADFLLPKLVAGTNITLTEQNDGGNENIKIDATDTNDDEKVKVSANDTTPGFLDAKLVAGTNVTLTELNDGGDEDLQISTLDEKVKVTANDTTPANLLAKLTAGTNITITELNDGGNETVEIATTAEDKKVAVSANDTTPDFLGNKVVGGSGITVTELNDGGDEDLEIKAENLTTANILTDPPITVKGTTNAEGVSTELARADHQHRLELDVEDSGGVVGSRPAIKVTGSGGITVTVADDGPNERVNIDVDGSTIDEDDTESFFFGNRQITAAADTRFLDPGRGGTAGLSDVKKIPLTQPGTLRRLFVQHNSAGGNGNSVTYKVLKNGVATGIFVSLATGAVGQASDLVNTIAVVAGDLISIEATKALGIGGGSLDVQATVELLV